MLDTDTKRRIDSCRDILVGKVPDPKSQVEQITIALIYKFMDDMDAQSEEFGGKRSFFVNGFEKYGWSKLLAPNMGGQDTLNLYSEAISKMTENTHLPALFRDIFKNAYLPYRDPETLKAFLKEIDGFSYDHSERLGDAFEYLLSVLGSQGDAGQFRTPRHIIDFIVRVVDPQKHERILDPACGTAGFLISAWKHILAQNQQHKPGDKLTPDERNKIAANIHGYDISPDMVRLSLVNLYLHEFANPSIHEYDTLSRDERWNEHANVILANPPFMTPKGGIKPHKKFSITSRRAELLFVDYIIEHLTPGGRAGIVIPSGILTDRSQGAQAIRSKLIYGCDLQAIISFPPSTFRPYADVETCVLIFKKGGHTTKVWMAEVSNDGYSQDDRRAPIDGSDLPVLLKEWEKKGESFNCFNVSLEEIKKNKNGLSIGSYKKNHLLSIADKLPDGWSIKKLGSIVSEVSKRAGGDHKHTVFSVTKHNGFVPAGDYFNKRIHSDDTSDYKVVKRGQFAYSTIHIDEGAVGYLDNADSAIISPMYKVFEIKEEAGVIPEFLYQAIKSDSVLSRFRDSGNGSIKRRKSVSFSAFENIDIIVPPLNEQKKIASMYLSIRKLEKSIAEEKNNLSNAVSAVFSHS
nr:N-6 DNA methylase [Massilia sp. JS1662]